MAAFNKVILIGHLTADPELKQAKSASVTSFTIGVNRRFKGADGSEETDFIRIAAWRKTAEFICRYFKKGMPILIVGQLQARAWTDENGQKRYANDVVAEEVSFVGKNDTPVFTPGANSEGSPNASVPNPVQWDGKGTTYMPPAYSGQQAQFEEIPNDDNLPF